MEVVVDVRCNNLDKVANLCSNSATRSSSEDSEGGGGGVDGADLKEI